MKKAILIVSGVIASLLLISVLAVSLYGVSSGIAYRPDSTAMDALRETKLRSEGTKRYFGKAWMEQRNGNYLLHLSGTPYEIGYQHGALLRDEVNRGAARFYADLINGGREMPFSIKIWLLRKYLEWKVYVPLEKAQPKNILEELKGIADGSGVPYDIIFRANHHTGPAMVLTPVLASDNIEAFQKIGIKVGACSSFAATGRLTANGGIIVGRNTDYGGVSLWPRYQTLLFVKPSEGFAHVKVGTAGVILWNPGMNTEGIVVCPHYMVYDDCDPSGRSIAAFTDEILRKAGSLKDAERIFHDNPRALSAGYIIASAKEKDAFAAELSTGKASIRRMENGRIVMTNMAVSEEKRRIDITVRFNIMEHCPARYRRLMQLIDAHRGAITSGLAASFMGDHIQYTTGLERAGGHVVGVADNENSMVFTPEDLRLWVAGGTAPVCNNTYRGFDLMKELEGSTSSVNPHVLKPYVIKDPKIKYGLEEFMRAYAVRESNPDDKESIIRYLKEAVRLDPGESHYRRLLAKYYIHGAKYDEALSVMEKTPPLKQSFRETGNGLLIRGMIHDLRGERSKALEHYKSIEEMAKQIQKDDWFAMNQFLLAFARKYSKIPFSKDNLEDQSVGLEFVDPYME